MTKRAFSLAVAICFLLGVVSLIATAQTDSKNFKKASDPDSKLKRDMLKSSEYKKIYRDIKSTGKKGPSSRERVRVYIKEAAASEVTINEKSRGGSVSRQVSVGAVFVDSGRDLEGQPSNIGIVMIGTGDKKGDYHGFKLTAEIGADGKPVASLVDARGKSVHDGPIEILKNPHLKVDPNGTAIASDNDNVLVLISSKRNGDIYALVIPSEVIVKIIGRMGSGSDKGSS